VLDGPLAPSLLAQLAGSLGVQRGPLALANGDRLPMPRSLTLLLEADDLSHASPAHVAACALVFFPAECVGWRTQWRGWLQQHPLLGKRQRAALDALAENFIGGSSAAAGARLDGLAFALRDCGPAAAPMTVSARIGTLCALLDGHFAVAFSATVEAQANGNDGSEGAGKERDEPAPSLDFILQKRLNADSGFPSSVPLLPPPALERIFLHSLAWALGGALPRAGRVRLDAWLRAAITPTENEPAPVPRSDSDHLQTREELAAARLAIVMGTVVRAGVRLTGRTRSACGATVGDTPPLSEHAVPSLPAVASGYSPGGAPRRVTVSGASSSQAPRRAGGAHSSEFGATVAGARRRRNSSQDGIDTNIILAKALTETTSPPLPPSGLAEGHVGFLGLTEVTVFDFMLNVKADSAVWVRADAALSTLLAETVCIPTLGSTPDYSFKNCGVMPAVPSTALRPGEPFPLLGGRALTGAGELLLPTAECLALSALLRLCHAPHLSALGGAMGAGMSSDVDATRGGAGRRLVLLVGASGAGKRSVLRLHAASEARRAHE